MNVIRSVYNYVKKNKLKTIGALTLVTGIAWYCSSSHQARKRAELHQKANLLSSAKSVANELLEGLLPRLHRRINEVSGIPETLEQVRRTDIDRETKIKLWDQLKLKAFATTLTTAFVIALAGASFRSLVSLLSKYIWVAKQRQKRHDEFYIDTCDLSSDVKQKLINTVTDHLFQKGVVTLMEYSLSAAEPLLANWNLKKECSFDEVIETLLTMRQTVEARLQTNNIKLIDLLLPPESGITWNPELEETLVFGDDIESFKLPLLLGELRNSFETPIFSRALSKCIQTVLAAESLKIKDHFVAPEKSPTSENAENGNKATSMVVARLIPSLHAVVTYTLNPAESTALVALNDQKELNELSATVFGA